MDRRTLRTIAISALAAMAVSLVFALPGASRSDALEKRIEELSAEISRQHDENEEMAASIAMLEAEIDAMGKGSVITLLPYQTAIEPEEWPSSPSVAMDKEDTIPAVQDKPATREEASPAQPGKMEAEITLIQPFIEIPRGEEKKESAAVPEPAAVKDSGADAEINAASDAEAYAAEAAAEGEEI